MNFSSQQPGLFSSEQLLEKKEEEAEAEAEATVPILPDSSELSYFAALLPHTVLQKWKMSIEI